MPTTTSRVKASSRFDLDTARRFLAALHRPGAVVELRCLDCPRRNLTTAGYFADPDQLISVAARLSGRTAIRINSSGRDARRGTSRPPLLHHGNPSTGDR
jgi:hypothetical protein